MSQNITAHFPYTSHYTCCSSFLTTKLLKKQPEGSHLSTNMVGESGRVVSRSVIVFHSLMQLCSEVMQLS